MSLPWNVYWRSSFILYFLTVIACNSGTQMRVRDSSATRIFFLKHRMMQHRAQNITIKFKLHLSFRLPEKKYWNFGPNTIVKWIVN